MGVVAEVLGFPPRDIPVSPSGAAPILFGEHAKNKVTQKAFMRIRVHSKGGCALRAHAFEKDEQPLLYGSEGFLATQLTGLRAMGADATGDNVFYLAGRPNGHTTPPQLFICPPEG